MNSKDDDINDYVPSILNPRSIRKDCGDFTLTQNSIKSRCSLSLKRNLRIQSKSLKNKNLQKNKENCPNTIQNVRKTSSHKVPSIKPLEDQGHSIGFSAIEDIASKNTQNIVSSPLSYGHRSPQCSYGNFVPVQSCKDENKETNKDDFSVLSLSSATELGKTISEISDKKIIMYDYSKETPPTLSISFGMLNCKNIDVSAKNLNISRIQFSYSKNNTSVECKIKETIHVTSSESECSKTINEEKVSPQKRSAVAVNLEIKKKKVSTEDGTESEKVLILNTNAITQLSHVIVQPPNYKLVKQQVESNKLRNCKAKNGKKSGKLKQITLNKYLKVPYVDSLLNSTETDLELTTNEVNNEEMIKNPNFSDGFKLRCQTGRSYQSSKNELSPHLSPRSYKVHPSIQDISHQSSPSSLRRNEGRTVSCDGPRALSSKSPRGSLSPKKNAESLQFPILAARPHSNKTASKAIPHFKIVAGTHFAVDAFSYGDIPNVQHYFLTHFHSDHYSGLRKSFSKNLYCSKITAELAMSRLGVNSKCIMIINIDDTLNIDGVEVTAVDANHCPGAIMLVFTLPNGKTILHTGDFRAYPAMESFPIFWNKDIHTIYLDTTYCNPRYDFPTQEESLEMALYLLRQKKMALEKAGLKFSQVLIVCGSYTIGKEKFFLGMARRIGCSVWACPEKDRVLRAVEGRSYSHAPPQSCQLHVVPMRDLAVDKLRQYLDSLQGEFTEVVAFKPSGWENGNKPAVEAEKVTVYGIPYSEHSSFSEMVRFVKFLKPKQVVPTVDISGGIKSVQKFFPCPLVLKEGGAAQARLADYFSAHAQPRAPPAAT